MIPGPRDTAVPADAPPEGDPAPPAQHSGYCSVCEVTEPFEDGLPLVQQLRAFMAAHEHD